MGVSRSPEELARKFTVAAKTVAQVNPDALKAAAQVYKAGVLAEGRKDSGGDLRLSNWGRKGVKLGAKYNVRGTGAQASAVVTPVPAGVWASLSSGTKVHDIYPGAKRPGRRRRGGKRALRFPDGRFAGGRVRHPGATGKRTWQRGRDIAEPRAKKVFVAAHRRGLLRVFR